jgi:imidazolonepropionase-like amidohydrolase
MRRTAVAARRSWVRVAAAWLWASMMALVEQIGMTPLQALRAATTIAANAIGLGESKGRIAAGADADVLAVRGDPVADIGSITNVQAVFRAGSRVR